jgi:hypothetical protein
VAVTDATVPPPPCVVTTFNVPHDAELQPDPESDQARIVLGLDPGTSVIVAMIAAVPLAGTLCGAVTCNVKLLVMVMFAEACFEGSARLCAMTVALTGEGRIPGAM